jgi:urease accessory protein
MRVFKSLYPEGPNCCHTVLVHPPGGLVGGDELDIDVRLDPNAHALISTPGAARFYASDDAKAVQRVRVQLAEGARLEWCPLEAIAYPGCRAESHWRAALAPGAQLLAWDLVALGLPATAQAFDHGHYLQRWSIDGLWREHARIDAADQRLMQGRLGLRGHNTLGTLVLAQGSAWSKAQQDELLACCRDALQAHGDVPLAATAPNPQMVVLRGLAHQAEPLMAGLQAAWAALRHAAWGLDAAAPRVWRV